MPKRTHQQQASKGAGRRNTITIKHFIVILFVDKLWIPVCMTQIPLYELVVPNATNCITISWFGWNRILSYIFFGGSKISIVQPKYFASTFWCKGRVQKGCQCASACLLVPQLLNIYFFLLSLIFLCEKTNGGRGGEKFVIAKNVWSDKIWTYLDISNN